MVVRGGKNSGDQIGWRTRRTSRFALGLLCVTAAAALVLARLYHLGAAIAASLLGGLPGFYLSLTTYRDDHRTEALDSQLSPAEVADLFAAAVRSQWLDEASVRRINDPYPLPVHWVPADRLLVDQWSTLTTLATSGAGWSRTGTSWASGPDELSGQDNQLAEVLARVPTGRLVILGEPGAGKTILMVRLVLDLLARRETGTQVPVLLSIASWDPASMSLREWLASELAITYTALIGPAQPRAEESDRIQLLLDARLIMPLLDGLDEMPDASRGSAIAKINDAMQAGDRFVMTCRHQAFRNAVMPPNGPPVTLRGAAGIELRPLDADAITSYLHADAGGSDGELRWRSVVASLRTDAPIARVLSNPLMLSLARTIYDPRPSEFTGPPPDPEELCAFRNADALESHLLSAFVPAVYRSRYPTSGPPSEWTAKQAEKWLAFLARHLERNIQGPELAWWQLSWATPRAVTSVATGLMAGLLTGAVIAISFIILFGMSHMFGGYFYAIPTVYKAALTGLKYAGAAGLAAGIVTAAAMTLTARGKPPASQKTRVHVARAATVGIGTGLLIGVVAWAWSLLNWVGVGLGCGAALLAAFLAYRADRRGSTLDVRNAAAAALVVGTVVGLTIGIAAGILTQRLYAGVIWGLGWGCAAGFTAAAGVTLKSSRNIRPARDIHWSLRKGIKPAMLAAVSAIFILVLAEAGSQFGLAFIMISALACGAAVGAVAGLERVADDLSAANTSPATALARDRNASRGLMAVTGTAAGLAVAIIAGSIFGANDRDPLEIGVTVGLGMGVSSGLAVGLAFGFAVNGFDSAWPAWLIARTWLALCRRLPLHVIAFLEDAHRRGVLRRAGPVYQFRHLELQHHLASEVGPETLP